MKKIPLIARLIFGFIFFASGIAGLFNLIPPPPEMPEKMQAFMTGFMAAGYFFPLLKMTEIICGLLLLIGWFVPLALVALAPITLNIFFVHLMLEPSGLPIAILLVVLQIYLSFFAPPYRQAIQQLFRKHV